MSFNFETFPNQPQRGFPRRQFIKQAGFGGIISGLAAACVTTPKASAVEPLVGSQLFGWGQYYWRSGKNLDDHLDEILSAVRDCGYDYAEHSLEVDRPDENMRFAERCRAKGLRLVSLYTGGRLHETGSCDETVQRILAASAVARRAGCMVLNCNPDPIGREKTDQELDTQVQALKALGEGLNAMGMRLGIHHHTPELRNGAREFHYNFQNSPPELIGFCYDVHWIFRGGLPPKEVLRQYGSRIVSWHLRQSRAGIWWEDLDSGDIDYRAIARWSRWHGLAPFYTVELALEEGTRITRDVVENHRRSREFMRAAFRC